MFSPYLSVANDTKESVNVSSSRPGNAGDKDSLDFLPLGLFILLLSSFGIIGNVLSAIVMLRPRMNSTYTIITLGLTFCDTIFLLTKLLRYGLQSMFTYFSVAREYTHVFYPIGGPAMKTITAISHTGLTYFTVAVAADRYFVVCWPANARKLWSINRSILLSVGVIIFSILYTLPQWWEHETVLIEINNGTDWYYKMQQTAFRKNPNYRVPYKIAHLFVMNFIPYILLIFMNTEIWRKINDARQVRRSLTSVQKKEKSFTVMLFSLVALFLSCSSLYFIKDMYDISKVNRPKHLKDIGNVLLTFNSAVNFLLYCMFGSRFRHEFVSFYKECLSCCYHRCILREEPVAGSRYDLSTTTAPTPQREVIPPEK